MKHTNLNPRSHLKHQLKVAKEPTLTFPNKSGMLLVTGVSKFSSNFLFILWESVQRSKFLLGLLSGWTDIWMSPNWNGPLHGFFWQTLHLLQSIRWWCGEGEVSPPSPFLRPASSPKASSCWRAPKAEAIPASSLKLPPPPLSQKVRRQLSKKALAAFHASHVEVKVVNSVHSKNKPKEAKMW